MPSKKIKVFSHRTLSDDASNAIMIDEQIIKALRIPDSRTVWLAAGSFRQKVSVTRVKRKGVLLLSKQLMHRIGMHEGLALHLHYDQEKQMLRCGPLFAVLLQRGAMMPAGRPFGEMSDFCRELAYSASREHVWLAAVTPKSFQLSQKTVHGWTYRHGWRRVKLPLPDVIYNRLQTRKVEKSQSVQQLMRNIKSNFNTVIFNEQFLDKISVFSALAKENGVHKYLPHSQPCRNINAIRHMLDKYPVLFLKPATGSMGRGIVRIVRGAAGVYTTQTTHLNNTSRKQYANQAALLRKLATHIRRSPHLIQQGLSLLTMHRHNLDFRALVQKDSNGAWSITSIVARIAAPRHFVSNLARGGRLTKVMDALLKAGVAHEKARRLSNELRTTAITIASALEKQMNGSFGELGVDLAVDKQHQIWLLEVNSKPSKTDPQLPGAGKIRPSARKVMQYAKYAAKF